MSVSIKNLLAFILLLAMAFGALACQSESKAGSFEVVFDWEDVPPADEDIFVYGKIEQRESLQTTGVQVAESSVLPYSENLRLDFSDTPYKDHLVVVVEIKDEASKSGSTLYYGLSDFFETRPGKHVVVTVKLSLVSTPNVQDHEDDSLGDSAIVILEASGPESCPNCYVKQGRVTLAVKAERAESLVVANDREFSEESLQSLTVASLETNDEGYLLIPEWDLNAGVPDAETDGPRRVYMKLMDSYGYESSLLQKQVTLDQTPPDLDGNLLSRFFAKAGDRVELSLNPSEILLTTPTLSVSPTNPGFPQSLDKSGESYSASCIIPDEGFQSGDRFTFQVTLTDLAGNETTVSLMRSGDEGEEETQLTLDLEPPRLLEARLLPAHEGTLYTNDASQLTVELSVEESIGLADGFPRITAGPLTLVQQQTETDGSVMTFTYAPLAEDLDTEEKLAALSGTHSVLVSLADQADNRETVGMDTVRFDFVAPLLTATVQAPRGAMAKLGETASLILSAKDGDTQTYDWLEEAGLMVESNPILSENLLSGPIASGASFIWTVTVTELLSGEYTFTLNAADLAGNQGAAVTSNSIRLDGLAPSVTLNGELRQQSVPDQPRQMTFSAQITIPDDDVTVDGISATLKDEAGYGEAMTVEALPTAGTYQASLTIDVDHFGEIVSEIFSASFVVDDQVGNRSQLESSPVQLDVRPPDLVSIDVTPLRDNGTESLTLSLTADERLEAPPLVRARIDGQDSGAFDIVFTADNLEGGSLRYDYSASWPSILPEEGEYTYVVQSLVLRDMAGNQRENVSPDTPVTFVLDLQAPSTITEFRLTPEDGQRVAKNQTLKVEFNLADDDLAANYPKVRIGPYTLTQDPAGSEDYDFAFVYTASGQEVEAEQHLSVELLDEAGNITESQLGSLSFDFTMPLLTAIVSPQERQAGADQEVMILVRADETLNEEGIQVSASAEWPGLQIEHVASGLRLLNTVEPDLSFQRITYSFTATDTVGNTTETPLEITLTLDGVKPAVVASSMEIIKDGVSYYQPVPVKEGDEIHFCFELNKDNVDTVSASFAELSLGTVDGQNGRFYCWSYTAQASDFQELDEPEGMKSFLLEMTDAIGNRGWASSNFPVLTLDFTPPELVEVEMAPQAASLGSTLAVWVRSSEILADSISVTASNTEKSILLRPVITEGRDRLFEHTVLESNHSEDAFTLQITYADQAGNQGQPQPYVHGENLIIDAIAPEVVGEIEVYNAATDGWLALSPMFFADHPMKAGSQLRLRFMVEEAHPLLTADQNSMVRVDGLALGTVQTLASCWGETPVCPQYVRAYEWNYTVAEADWTTPDGDVLDGRHTLSMHLSDAPGNVSPILGLGQPMFDFHAPDLSAIAQLARCDEYAPARLATNALRVKAEGYDCSFAYACDEAATEDAGPVRIAFSMNEAVDLDSVSLTVEGGSAFVLDPCATTQTYIVGTYHDFNHEAGTRNILLDVSDHAGNQSNLIVGIMEFDFDFPAAPDTSTPGQFTYYRIPWGNEATEGAKEYYVAGTAGAVTPGSQIVAYNCLPDADAMILGSLEVREDGSFGAAPGEEGAWSIPSGNSSRVCLAERDQAGNLGPMSLVQEVEWVVTMGYKNPGDTLSNPHDFRAIKHFDPVLTQKYLWEVEEPSLVALPSGMVQTKAEGVWRDIDVQTWDPRMPYWGATTTYDTNRGRGLVYGGCTHYFYDSDSYCQMPSNKFWAWEDGQWSLLQPPSKPSERSLSAMSFSPVDDQVVLFGGKSSYISYEPILGDTWVWKNERWRELELEESPSRRFGHAMAYDAAEDTRVLFGGCTALTDNLGSCSQYSDETYLFKNGAWQLVESYSSPSARMDHRMIYNPATQQILLFGGQTADGQFSNEVWMFITSIGQWFQLDDAPIDARMGHMMVYDEASARILVLGGASSWTDEVPDGPSDVWAYDQNNGVWEEVVPRVDEVPQAPETIPQDIVFAAGFYDRRNQSVVQLGGVGFQFKTWRWDSGREYWQDISLPTIIHTLTNSTKAFYDDAQEQVVFYCGECSEYADGKGVLLGWNGYSWHDIVVAGDGPNPIHDYAMAYDAENEMAILFGGYHDTEPLNQTWLLAGSDSYYSWHERPASPVVDPPNYAAMSYDTNRQQMILQAIYIDSNVPENSYTNDYIWNGYGYYWSEMTTLNQAQVTMSPGMVYDPSTDQTIRFSGFYSEEIRTHDLSILSYGNLGPYWTRSSGLAPLGRWDHGMVYDDDRAAVILFGGGAIQWTFSDTWELKNNQWREVDTGGPDARKMFGMAYHKTRKKTVIYGGTNTPGDVWLYDSGANHKPAHLVDVVFSSADAGDLVPTALEIHWRGGASGSFAGFCMDMPGTQMVVWDQGRWWNPPIYSGGTPDEPDTIIWSTEDPVQLARLFTGDSRTLTVGIVPVYPSSCSQEMAEVRTDYVEAIVRYRMPEDEL